MPAASLLTYLKQLQRQGQTHIHVDAGARRTLRELYQRGSAQQNAPGAKEKISTPPSPSQFSSPTSSEPGQTSFLQSGEPIQIETSGNTAAEKIASLVALCAADPRPLALGTLRSTMVFSAGNPQADLMLVGEGPGYQEEMQKAPFVGPAGQKLDAILKTMGLSRQAVYLSNVCKFRPGMKNQTTGNRKPTPQEMATTLPYLREEIDVVKPKVIVALGATAAEGLLETRHPVGKLRGEWHQFQGIPLRVTYHPSYLLHSGEGLTEKRKLWEDMLAVMERLKIPISEKQRRFFLPKN